MAQPERYFIGPNVREKLTEVFTRVGGMAAGSGGQTPGTWLQDIQRPPGQAIRAATFTGSWAIGTTNTVTFKYEPTATMTVTNLTWPLGGCSQSETDCIVGKDSEEWLLLTPNLASLQSYNATNIQMLGHAASGCLRWFDIANCSTATAT